MENEEGLVLVDQHAAHERILFRATEAPEWNQKASPDPASPDTADSWSHSEGLRLDCYQCANLEKMGFSLEPFGNSTLKIDGIPQFFRTDDPSVTIRQLVDELRSMTTSTSRLRMGEDVIARTVCRHAIKANDELHRQKWRSCCGTSWTASCPTAARTEDQP